MIRPIMRLTTESGSDGKMSIVYTLDPLRSVDEFAVLSNGSVAFVRGHDYHVDWLRADEALAATPKVPFEWKQRTDDDKTRLMDSVRIAQNALLANGYPMAEMMFTTPCEAGPPPAGASGRSGGGGGGDAPPRDPNGCYQISTNLVAAGVGILRPPSPPLADLTRHGLIDDYEAPIRPGSTVADLDGNLWILPRTTTLARKGELVYDVVNAKGELFERVRLPLGRADRRLREGWRGLPDVRRHDQWLFARAREAHQRGCDVPPQVGPSQFAAISSQQCNALVSMRSLVSIFGVLAIAITSAAARAQQTDVIRGRVMGSDSLLLQGANVRATSYQGGVTKNATTDKGGRFTLIFINGEGDYWIDFTKVGYAPKRFEIRRVGDEEVLLADARLSSLVPTLGTVKVTGDCAGVRSKIYDAVLRIDGVLEVDRIRIRRAGNRYFADLAVGLARTVTFQRSGQLVTAVTEAVHQVLPDADVTVQPLPRAQGSENIFDRIRAVATERNLNVHDISVQDFAGQLHVEQHIELDERMTLKDAHDQVTELEADMRRECRKLPISSPILRASQRPSKARRIGQRRRT